MAIEPVDEICGDKIDNDCDGKIDSADEDCPSILSTDSQNNEDTVPPVITLLGDSTVNINVGDNYVDAGATASDDVDGDITGSIVVADSVDTSAAGTYAVSYNVSDAVGNTADEVVRTVIVKNACVPDWQAGDWQSDSTADSTACGTTFTETMTYTDANNCGDDSAKPADETREVGGIFCEARPNADGVCQSDGGCAYTCLDGFTDANSDLINPAGDGCESAITTDTTGTTDIATP